MSYDLRYLGGCKPKPALARFEASYVPDPNTGCWLWLGAERGSNGYGGFKVDGVKWAAHRYSWAIHKGPIPNGMQVCHRCDVPACVNPMHLFLGTGQDNTADKVAKNRQSKGASHSAAKAGTSAKGEHGGMSKLKTEQVLAIRADRRTQRVIARDYGITQAAVSAIITRKTWSHI